MRLNNDWLNIINAQFGQIDGFKIYEGVPPSPIGAAFTPSPADLPGTTSTGTSIATGQAQVYGIDISPDGTKMYACAESTSQIWQYTMSTPFDLATATLTYALAETADGNPIGLYLKPDGTALYIAGYNNDLFHQYNMSVPFDLSTATVSPNNIGTAETFGETIGDMQISPDGTYLIAMHGGIGQLYRATMSTPWNLATAVKDVGISYNFGNNVRSFHIANDGLTVFVQNDYISGINMGGIVEFKMTIPWDLSTAVSSGSQYIFFNAASYSYGYMVVNEDGTKLYVTGWWNDGAINGFNTAFYGSQATHLVDLTQPFNADANNAFAAVTDAAGTRMVWQGSTVTGAAASAGEMGCFVMQCSGNGQTFLVDGTVTATGGGGDVEFASTTVAEGGTVAIEGLNFIFNGVFNY